MPLAILAQGITGTDNFLAPRYGEMHGDLRANMTLVSRHHSIR